MKKISVLTAICLVAVSAFEAELEAAPKTRTAAANPVAANRESGASNRREENRILAARTAVEPGKRESAAQVDQVWTNERLERLAGQGLISEFNQLPEARADVARTIAPDANIVVMVMDRLQDPRWYAEQAAAVGAKIQALELELVRYQSELYAVRNLRTMEAGLAFYQDTVGITPDDGIKLS
jgi:hypothetical protein